MDCITATVIIGNKISASVSIASKILATAALAITATGIPSNCEELLFTLTDAQKNECILPDYDFTDPNVTDKLTAEQIVDLDEFINPSPPNALATIYDGVNEFADLGTSDIIPDGSLEATYSIWLKTTISGTQFFMGRYAGGNLATTPAMFLVGGIPFFFMGPNISNFRSGITDVADGLYHNVVCVFKGDTNLDIYVDAVLDNGALTGLIVSSVPDNSVGNTLGANIGLGSFFNGTLDEPRIWNKALSPSEIVTHFNLGKPLLPSEEPAQGNLINSYRKGDGDTFPIITDNTGIFNGTLINMEPGDFIADVP